MPVILDGRQTARRVREDVRGRVEDLARRGVVPGLAVVQVGTDHASSVYVRNKRRTSEALGIRSFAHDMPLETTEGELLARVDALNADPAVHGVLVQLPLPASIDPSVVVDRVAPDKDVDGFHPLNVGRLALGRPAMVPCTPAGVMVLLERHGVELEGRRALVIGRSAIVGKPMAQLLLAANATVTVAHSRSRGLPDLAREADVLIAAAGRRELVRGDWVRPGAAVVDVGIHRREDGSLCGDVAFEEAAGVAGYLSPVPGGVGPMTIAMLMRNVTAAAERASGLSSEEGRP